MAVQPFGTFIRDRRLPRSIEDQRRRFAIQTREDLHRLMEGQSVVRETQDVSGAMDRAREQLSERADERNIDCVIENLTEVLEIMDGIRVNERLPKLARAALLSESILDELRRNRAEAAVEVEAVKEITEQARRNQVVEKTSELSTSRFAGILGETEK